MEQVQHTTSMILENQNYMSDYSNFLATSDLKLSSLMERFVIVASNEWRSEMMKATRYVDMGTVSL